MILFGVAEFMFDIGGECVFANEVKCSGRKGDPRNGGGGTVGRGRAKDPVLPSLNFLPLSAVMDGAPSFSEMESGVSTVGLNEIAREREDDMASAPARCGLG